MIQSDNQRCSQSEMGKRGGGISVKALRLRRVRRIPSSQSPKMQAFRLLGCESTGSWAWSLAAKLSLCSLQTLHTTELAHKPRRMHGARTHELNRWGVRRFQSSGRLGLYPALLPISAVPDFDSRHSPLDSGGHQQLDMPCAFGYLNLASLIR